MSCLPLYSFYSPFSPIDTEIIRPPALWIYIPRWALLTQVPPCPSSSPPKSLLPPSTLAHLDTFIVGLYQVYFVLSCFERVGSLSWASLGGCGRLQEVYQKWRRGILRSASSSENEEKPQITSTTLNRWVKILKFYHGCQTRVIFCYLTDLSEWAWNYQLLYSAFNSVAYRYSGHILISWSLVLDLGEPCLRLDMDKVYSMKRNISKMLKTSNHLGVR